MPVLQRKDKGNNEMSDQKFRKLLEPFHIGKVKTRNRIIKTASGTSFWSPGERRVTEKGLAYYEALARGGVGLIMFESPIVEYPFDEPGDVRLRIDDDRYIEEIAQLPAVIHKHGCPVFVQFYHRGPWLQPYAANRPHVAASPVVPPSGEFDLHGDEPPRELTISEIQELSALFSQLMVRLKKAGFDGMEINAGCDHIFATFLSRYWNKRRDAYGFETMENRSRFLVETIKGIKNGCGEDFPVSVLINAVEGGMGSEGMTLEESKALAILLEKAGADSLHVRSHFLGHHVGSYNHENLFYPERCAPVELFPKGADLTRHGREFNVPFGAAIKKVVSIPIITVSGIVPKRGEKILREGKADFIGMCRPLFADPELPNKLAAGRHDDIAPCTRCSTCQKMNGLPKECRVDAALGTTDYQIKKAATKKRVIVVGGGPAGLEAARVAGLRGHEVILVEKARSLGGVVPIAAMVKGLDIEKLPALTRYLKRQVVKAGVTVRTGKTFDAALIDEIKPDVVILAAGGVAPELSIPGANRRNVVTSHQLHGMLQFFLTFFGPGGLRWLSRFWMPVGKKVVIVGGMIAGCQLAEFLTKRGRKVTIVDEAENLGEGLIPERKTRLFSWFRKKGVVMLPGVAYNEITDKGLAVATKEGKRMTLEADTIIPVLPFVANADLIKEVDGKAPEVYVIGDCKGAGLIVDAIADGWRTGNLI